MKVGEKEVDYVAALAHLDLTADERSRMVRDLNSILEHIDALNELDTSDVPPMAQVGVAGDSTSTCKETDPSLAASFARTRREDEPRPSLPHQQALANSPAKHPDFFKVPRVIES